MKKCGIGFIYGISVGWDGVQKGLGCLRFVFGLGQIEVNED